LALRGARGTARRSERERRERERREDRLHDGDARSVTGKSLRSTRPGFPSGLLRDDVRR